MVMSETGEGLRVGLRVYCGLHARCAVCGDELRFGDVIVVLPVGAPVAESERYVCSTCAGAGPSGAQVWVRERVAELRKLADGLEVVADGLPSAQGWPSADDIERLKLELDAERRAGVLAEQDIPF